jgi:mannose-1-phosphate guanylyltransferase/phosphomannomutase
MGEIDFPDRAAETYLRALRNACDEERIAARGYRFVIDYGSSPAAIIQQLMTTLRAEVVAMNAFAGRGRRNEPFDVAGTIAGVQRMVTAMGADLGVIFEPAAELLYLVDDRGHEVPLEKALLLFVKLVCEGAAGRGARIALPLTVTRLAEKLAADAGVEVVRTKVSLSALTEAASAEGVVFAGTNGGGYIFPQFLCAYDAVMSVGKLLELLAPHREPLSEIVAALPSSTLVHKTAGCPWALKGTVMRTITEEMQRAAEGEVGLLDGVRLSQDGRWVQILPDSDEPVFHIYAEAETASASAELADRYVLQVRSVVERRE